MDMARVCACITYRSERGLYWSRPTGYASLRLTASVPCAQSQSQNISPKFPRRTAVRVLVVVVVVLDARAPREEAPRG